MKILENHKMRYLYDFGDGWDHLIHFEGSYPKAEEQKYPVCIDGKRACPPEDVGGSYGYECFLKVINDPKHEEHIEMLTWIGGKYNPEEFNPEKVKFGRPGRRWEQAFNKK